MLNMDYKKVSIQLLKDIAEAHGAPGHESELRDIFRRELGENMSYDKTGSIIYEKKGTEDLPKIMVAAHMDEVGFIVQSIKSDGLIKFATLGGWWTHTIMAQRVWINTQTGQKILGVVASKPPHFLSEGERKSVMKVEDMFIDIGAKSLKDVKENFGIKLGDPIVPFSPFTQMHNEEYLMCKAFDDRAGFALTVQTAKMLDNCSHPNTVYCVGTVQEELGVRGAQTAVSCVNPDLAIVLEGAPADDLPGFALDDRQGALTNGVQIRILDPTALMNPKFAQFVIKTAEENGISHQVTVRRSGGTDARVIHLHNTGVPTIVLAVPSRYIHTHNGIININDYLSALELVNKLVTLLDEKTVKSFINY